MNKKKFSYAFLLALLAIFSLQNVKAENSNQVIVGKIDSDTTDQSVMITVRLDKKPPFERIYLNDHGNFIQFSLPNALVTNPGFFLELKGKVLAKIATFQIDETKAMFRIFTNENASEVLKYSEIDILDNRIVFSFNEKKFVADKSKNLASSLPSKRTLKKIKNNQSVEDKSVQSFLTVKNQRSISIAIILLILFAAGFLALHRLVKRKTSQYEEREFIKMKPIGHLALAPKQRLSLVQVGGENVLLSISSDQVQFLTKIDTASNTSIQGKKNSPLSSDQLLKRAEIIKSQALRAVEEKKIAPKPIEGKKQNQNLMQKKPVRKAVDSSEVSKNKRIRVAKKADSKQPKIQVKIGDDGIQDTLNKPNRESVQDVTQMIREKLKSMPKI